MGINHLNWLCGILLTIVPTIISLRDMDLDSMDVALIGGGILWVWIAVRFSEFSGSPWRYLQICQRKCVWWPVAGLIVLVFVGWAYRVRGGPLPQPVLTSDDVARIADETAAKTAEQLMKRLVAAQKDEEQRLREDYPFGYVMVAFSGETKAVLPYPSRFDCDWDEVTVSRQGDVIAVEIPYLRDTKTGVSFENVAVGTRAIPGSKGSPPIRLADCAITLECLKAEPIGIIAVLGFPKAI